MKFFLECIPPKGTHQASQQILKRKDGTPFIGSFKNSAQKEIESMFMTLLYSHRPPMPLSGPLQLHVGWVYPWRNSETKKAKTYGWKWSDKRPDASNIIKLLEDMMTKMGFWLDDSQIARLIVDKGWSDRPGIQVEITQLPVVGGMPHYLQPPEVQEEKPETKTKQGELELC
jgi:Holliday junction resolvase RusA-like endonuclease